MVIPYWISFVENVDTCKWNFTADGSEGDCAVWIDPNMVNNKVTFLLNNPEENIDNFRFSDIVSFNFSLTVDPLDALPKGKGDVHSMVLGYTR